MDIPPQQLESFNTRQFYLKDLCDQRAANCSGKNREALEKFNLNCQMEYEGAGCNDLITKYPDLAPHIRRCDIESLCKQNYDYLDNYLSECWESYKEVTGEEVDWVKETAKTFGDYINEGWEKLKNNVIYKEEFLKECNKSLVCKRDLVKGDPGYENLSDEKLNQLPASFLHKRAQKVKGILAASNSRKSSFIKVKNGEISLNAEDVEKLQRLLGVSEAMLKKQYQQYVCYSPLAQQKLRCYAVGGVVDPLTVLGVSYKVGKIVKQGIQ